MTKQDKKIKKVSKTSIIIAWILLSILIISAITITYLRFFGTNDNLEEHPVNDTNVTSPVITEALQNIVDNFNNCNLLNDYKNQNITITASLNNDNIMIDYIGTSEKAYNFEFHAPRLTITINTNDTIEVVDKEFNEIFKILIYATQSRLNNTNNIDSYITGFLNDNLEVEGLSKEINDSSITYSIDVSKVIGDTANNNENNTTENNNATNSNNTSTDNSTINNGEEGE